MTQSKLEKLLIKRDQINARIQQAEALERIKRRKTETRRKIIAGAIAINVMEENPQSTFAKEYKRHLHADVTREQDRELFGLPVRVADSFKKTGSKS